LSSLSGLNTLPLSKTESLVVNAATTGSQVSTNSSALEIHPGTTPNNFFQPVTTCNEVVPVISNKETMVDPDKELSYKDSLPNSPVKSDTDKENNASLIPNEVPTPLKETHKDLSHIDFSNSDMEYWSTISLKDIGILDEDFFDHTSSTHSQGDA